MIIKFKLLNKIDFNKKISLKNLKKGGAEKFIIIIKKKLSPKILFILIILWILKIIREKIRL